ncbi:uncharacterized protein LOC107025981 [Solanum pennellii]|uniref:Uncharacterized protein LOC107025981 n=1 Tax=Solanum pennellii TaxID=28526 RepID=A0ABM1VEB7_SOLPN|nr:uncharacterized protein LOC107025981 [Solanum pennellii]
MQYKLVMATEEVAEHGGDHRKHHLILSNLERTIKEEEQAERELDVNELSQLCQLHGKGIPASRGLDQRKATAEICEFDDDGSGQLAEKCKTMCQQADHFRCYK